LAGLPRPDGVEEPHDDDRELAFFPVRQRQEFVDGLAARVGPSGVWPWPPITRSASSRNGTSRLLPYTSDVDAMNTSFFFLFACLRTTSVPCTLVSIVCTGCSTISLTPTARRSER
jgi:hypothetical protein